MAECILRDLTLKEAIQRGVSKDHASIQETGQAARCSGMRIQRRGSFSYFNGDIERLE